MFPFCCLKRKQTKNDHNNNNNINTENNTEMPESKMPIELPSCPFEYVRYLSEDQQKEIQKRWGKEHFYKYYVVKPLHRTLSNGQKVTVPLYFLTDGCSGPGIDKYGEQNWLAHDWMYAVHKDDEGKEIDRSVVDSVMASWHRRIAVRLFGGEAWDESGDRPAERRLYLPEDMRPDIDNNTKPIEPPSCPFEYVRDLSKDQQKEIQKRWGKEHFYKYYVVKPLHRTLSNGQKVTVPLYFLTDGCSGPGIDKYGEQNWLAHDWMYAVHKDDEGKEIEKSVVDSVMDSWHRRIAVELFGGEAWEESGDRPAERRLYLPEDMRPDIDNNTKPIESD